MAATTIRIGSRPRRWPVYVIAGLVGLAIVFTVLSGFVIDVLWFREIDKSSVYWTTLQTKSLLGLVFGAAFFALLYVNLLIAQWLTPETRVLTPDQEILERIREGIDPYVRWLLPLGALVLALFVGIGASGQWDTFALWRNGSGLSFGNAEEQFGRDPAFYVFTLPWLRFVQGWLFSSLVGVTVITALAHALWGGIRPQAPVFADKVTPAVRAHLSVLLGLIFLVKAWGYWIGRFDLLTSERGYVQGASYTDVTAQIPALTFLAVVAAICAVLFFVNIRVRLWSLPLIAVVLLGVVSVLLGAAYPAFVQQFRVRPNEQEYEREYIERNIRGTRAAFGLDQVVQEQRDVGGDLTVDQRAANETTMENIRLWRPEILLESFQSLQRIRQYYDFPDIDVDRYETADGIRLLMVSPREIIQSGIPTGGGTWTNEHLTYTHGYGVVAAQVNTSTSEGQPQFTLQDIPPRGDPPVPQIAEDRAGIYFGEKAPPETTPFVVVGTASELDYEGGAVNPYVGDGGIQVGNLLQRAMFAWRFRDVNLLTTGQIGADSRILINRDIRTRVPKVAPFLGFDADPYMTVIDGEPQWIWDAYAVTNEYPYSESIDVGVATDGELMPGEINYMRNSVKVVIDAYDGTMTYYADLEEPIVAAWAKVFPDLFTDIGTASEDLRAHFRYPENLFQVQAEHYANYHVTEPDVFYQKQDFWQVPADPTAGGVVTSSDGTVSAEADPATLPRLRPAYMLSRLPDQTEESFRLVVPFVPEGRNNMVAWLTASSDPGDYGSLIAYRFPSGRNIEGPSQVFARMNQDEAFSRERTLLGQTGSRVLFGDFLVIPVEETFLYVQPVYVRASQQASLPELKFVLVVNGSDSEVSLGSTLDEALDAAIGADDEQEPTEPTEPGEPGEPQEPTEPTGSVEQQIEELLAEALTHFIAADEALREGDLATYQEEIALAEDLVAEAEALAAGRGSAGAAADDAGPSPSPSG